MSPTINVGAYHERKTICVQRRVKIGGSKSNQEGKTAGRLVWVNSPNIGRTLQLVIVGTPCLIRSEHRGHLHVCVPRGCPSPRKTMKWNGPSARKPEPAAPLETTGSSFTLKQSRDGPCVTNRAVAHLQNENWCCVPDFDRPQPDRRPGLSGAGRSALRVYTGRRVRVLSRCSLPPAGVGRESCTEREPGHDRIQKQRGT